MPRTTTYWATGAHHVYGPSTPTYRAKKAVTSDVRQTDSLDNHE